MINLPLRHLIPLLFAAAGLIIVGAHSFYSAPKTRDQALRFATNQAETELQSLQGRLNQSLTEGDLDLTARDMFFSAADPKVQAIFLFDDTDNVLKAHRSRYHGRSVSDLPFTLDAERLKNARRSGAIDLEIAPSTPSTLIGYAGLYADSPDGSSAKLAIVIVWDYSRLLHEVTRIAAQPAELLTTLLIGLALLITFVISRRLTKRLEPIIDAASRIGRGETEVKTELDGQDEFADMSRAIDAMAVQVDSAKQALADALNEAELANASKSAFLSSISREVRTPLSSVVGFLDLVAEEQLDDETAMMVSAAQASANALTLLINDLLDMSRIESGEMDAQSQPFCLTMAVQAVVDATIHRAQEKGLFLRVRANKNDPIWLMGDESIVRQVFLKLTEAGLAVAETGGVTLEIQLSGQPRETRVSLSMATTGGGIPFALLDQIRRGELPASLEGVTGWQTAALCLTFLRHYTAILGGELSIVGTPGAGLRFAIDFQSEQTTAMPILGKESVSDFGEKRLVVLVADSSHANRLLLSTMLSKWHHHVVAVNTGTDALEELQKRLVYGNLDPFDLIIVDQHLCDMSGVELARDIKGISDSYADTPIIGLSTEEHGAMMQSDDTLFDQILVAPLDRVELKETLFRLSHKRRKESGSSDVKSGSLEGAL